MQELKEPAFGMLKTKLKIQGTKNPNNAYWPYCIGVMHENSDEYEKAIPFYEEAQRKDADDINLRRIAQCYYELGDFDSALRYINQTIELDSTKVQYIPFKANVLYAMGNAKVTTEVPFTKENGICNVKCKINDLPLYFVFDTGASTVSLSMVEATFMMKKGYLDKKRCCRKSVFPRC